MPLHGYTTDRRPPTNMDHLYAHPYSFAICLFQIVAGAGIVASLLWHFSISPSLSRLPESLLAFIAALMLLGGISIMRGLLDDSDDLMVGWRTERTGLVLSATAWGAYAITVGLSFFTSFLPWTSGLVLASAHIIRFRATRIEEKRVRARIAEHTRP